jgi:hypothetical protein
MSTAKWLRLMAARLDVLAGSGHDSCNGETIASATASATTTTIVIRHDPHSTPEPVIFTLELPARPGECGNEPT